MADIILEFGVTDKNGAPVKISERYIENISSLSQTTTDASSIQYGVLENSGKIIVYDIDGRIYNLVENGTIDSEGTPITIRTNNEHLLQKHISSDNDYNKNTRQLTMSLGNKLKDLSILKYKGYIYPNEPKTAYEVLYDVMYNLYGAVWTDYSVFDGMLTSDAIYGNDYITDVKGLLQKTTIKYPIIESGRTYREVIDEFCNMFQLQVFITDEDKIKFISARPITTYNNNVIQIPYSRIFSEIEETVIPKNKYDGIELNQTKPIEEVDADALLHTTSGPYTSQVLSDDNRKGNPNSAEYYASVAAVFYSGTAIIPKYSEDNTTRNDAVLTGLDARGEPHISHIIHYNYSKGGAKLVHYSQTDSVYEPDITETGIGSGTLSRLNDGKPINVSATAGSATASVEDLTNLNNVQAIDKGDYFQVEFTILAGYTKLAAQTLVNVTTGTYEAYYPFGLEVSFYGKQWTLSFEQESASSEDIALSKNKVFIPSGKLLQTTTLIDGNELSNNIKNTIINDYRDGVKTATLTVSCADYYNQNGAKVIDWTNGEVLQNEDIISIEKDLDKHGNPRIWKIVSREFSYEGVPMIKLGLVEIEKKYAFTPPIPMPSVAGFYRDDTYKDLLISWKDLIANNILKVDNGVLSQGDRFYDMYRYFDCNPPFAICLDSSVTSIEDSKFWSVQVVGTPSISSLIVPSSVKTLKGFYDSDINFIQLSEGLENIEINYARINKIIFPSTIKSLISHRLNIIDATSIKNNNIYDSRDNCLCIIESATNKLIIGSTNGFIPDGITAIGDYAFELRNKTSIHIPDSVKEIGRGAFSGCKLESIEIPYSINSIPDTFCSNNNISKIHIPSNIHIMGNSAFYRNPITNITFDEGITEIGDRCFAESDIIEELILPNSLTRIGTSCFEKIINLTIGENLKYIGDYSLNNYGFLETVTINSPYVANSLEYSSSCGGLIWNRKTIVYIRDDLDTSSSTYLNDNYTITTSDKIGYTKYIRK